MKLAAFLVLLLCGCGSQAAWVYLPGEKIVSPAAPFKARIAVLPLRDARGNDNTNATWVAFVPLFPFGWSDFERAEGGSLFLAHSSYNSRPPEDFAKAIVQEVKQTGLVSEVFYTERENEPAVDYVLTGELRSALYQGKMLTYLLSFAGGYLWLLGVPAGTSSNELDLTLELRRPGSPEVLWSHPFRGEYGRVIGLYYNFSAELEGYPKLLRQALEEALPSLQAKLAALDITASLNREISGAGR